ncbi:DUF2812 domain-containing protein [Clostridium sp. 1001275B_160808_H3]|uniref:DUF2812 domain-containing protein n=1 Tax=Clostridium sp. 1001275B_160808_H3 TaxID=2787110 RepID=UPI0018982F84|nr:DUF2812 domain-containing protein [Clostridium sp. 1001275B_160808_H3]
MVLGNKKWVIFNFLPYEYKSLEEYLEKMALKGWILEGMNGFILKFRRSKPKSLKYSVDIMDSVSFFDGKDSDSLIEYREYCKEAGWEFVCGREKIQVYCSEIYQERIDIHTDEVEKFNTIRKASLKYVCLNFFTMLILLYSQYISTIGSPDGHFLASSLKLGSLLFVSFFSIHEIIGVITFLIFNIRGKLLISKGKKISYNFKVIALIKRTIYKVLFIVTFTAFIFYGLKSDLSVIKICIACILLVALLNYIIRFVKDKNYKNKKTIISSVYLLLTLAIFFIMTNTIATNVFIRDYKVDDKMLEKVATLKLEDFNDIGKDDSLFYILDKSPVALHLFYSCEGENDYLSYDIFESKYQWAVRYNLNKTIEFDNKAGIEYIEKKTNLPNDIKVYMNERGNRYIIISPKKMVEISTIEGISEDEVINRAYEKLFSS